MTREDAFEIWLPIIKMGVKSMPECSEALDMAIKALKQEPCTDAISRQAAIYVINHAEVNFSVESEIDFTKHKREVHEIIENVLGTQEKALKELPPVTPAEKVGHWEWVQYDSNPNIGNWHCSECRMIIPHMPEETDNTPIYRWCPYCGAKMSASPTGAESEGGTQHERP